MDSSSKFFFSFSVNYAMIIKLVDLIVLLGSKLLNRFRKSFNINITYMKKLGMNGEAPTSHSSVLPLETEAN